MKLDLDRLRVAVQAVEPKATVQSWASSDYATAIRLPRPNHRTSLSIDLWKSGRSKTEITRCSVKGARERAVLRAVIDELDRQEGV